MRLTFLSTGTSSGVPVVACERLVCSSGDPRNHRTRASLLVQDKGRSLLIDTPPDLRQQALRGLPPGVKLAYDGLEIEL